MTKKSIAVIVAAVVIFVGIFVWASLKGTPGSSLGGPGGTIQDTGPVTRESLPRNVVIVVPDTQSADAPENVAVPETVAPAGGPQRGDSKYRSFEIKISVTKFEPDTIIARIGDTVRISATAVGGDYDLFQPDYDFRVPQKIGAILKSGETQSVQFDATAEGKFVFFCKSCGGPENGPVGYFVVAPKE